MRILRWQNKDENHNHHDNDNDTDDSDDDDDDDDQVLVGGGHELAAVVSVAWSHHPDVRKTLKYFS